MQTKNSYINTTSTSILMFNGNVTLTLVCSTNVNCLLYVLRVSYQVSSFLSVLAPPEVLVLRSRPSKLEWDVLDFENDDDRPGPDFLGRVKSCAGRLLALLWWWYPALTRCWGWNWGHLLQNLENVLGKVFVGQAMHQLAVQVSSSGHIAGS